MSCAHVCLSGTKAVSYTHLDVYKRQCQKNLDVTRVAYVLVDAFLRGFLKAPAVCTVSS